MEGSFCQANLLPFFDRIKSLADKSSCVVIVYLDFSMAFDLVPHDIFIKKLALYGINRHTHIGWITNWFKYRSWYVVVNGVIYISSSVPQGSALDPLLFNICINNPDNVMKPLVKSGDDTKTGGAVNNEDDRLLLQIDLITSLNGHKPVKFVVMQTNAR